MIVQSTMTPEELTEWEEKARTGDLFPRKIRVLVEKMLLERASDGGVSYGVKSEIARAAGVDESTVRYVARRLGLSVLPRRFVHGSLSGYTRGCRCADCKRAMRDYQRVRRQG